MKNARILLLLLIRWQFSNTAFAQLTGGVAGTWKRTAMTSMDINGITSDDNASMLEAMPCARNITYTFKTDGSSVTNVPDECRALKKALESMNGDGKFTLRGNKLIVTSSKVPTATTNVEDVTSCIWLREPGPQNVPLQDLEIMGGYYYGILFKSDWDDNRNVPAVKIFRCLTVKFINPMLVRQTLTPNNAEGINNVNADRLIVRNCCLSRHRYQCFVRQRRCQRLYF